MRATTFALALAAACLAAGPAHAANDIAAPQAQARPRQTPPPPPPTTQKPTPVPPSAPRPDAAAAAKPQPQPIPHDRGIAFVDVAYQPGTANFTEKRGFTVNRETASLTTDYKVKAGAGIDGGAFVRLWRRFGVGLSVSSIVRDSSASVAGSYPHPFFFNQARSGAFDAGTMDRAEVGLHPSIAWIAPASKKLRFTVFAGPSFFTITQTVVDTPTLTDVYPYDTITLAPGTTKDLDESAVGVHAGVDATWYFTSRIGAGVLARFATGTVSTSVNGGDSFDLKAGGAQIGVGLRFKF
jgi:hypothetical protein